MFQRDCMSNLLPFLLAYATRLVYLGQSRSYFYLPGKSDYRTSGFLVDFHLSGFARLPGTSRSPASVSGLLRNAKGRAQNRRLERLGGQGSFGFSIIWSVRTANSKKLVKV